MKFVNCTEIQAVHFRGQLWYQIILIMQISSPGGQPPVVPGDCGATSASRPAIPVATAHLLGWHSSLLPGRGRGQPMLGERGGGPEETAHRDYALFLSLASPKSGKSEGTSH